MQEDQSGREASSESEQLDPNMDLDDLDSDDLDALEAKLMAKSQPPGKSVAKLPKISAAEQGLKPKRSKQNGAADNKDAAADKMDEDQQSQGGLSGGGDDDGGGNSAGDKDADDGMAASSGEANVPDSWEAHCHSSSITDEQVAGLLSAKLAYKAAVAQAGASGAASAACASWRCHGCSFPTPPSSLAAGGVKERLQARWRDVHQVRWDQ